MYGFNGEVPGPLIRVPQNATIIVRFHNRIDLPSAVHWHGVRLDNRFDGVPGMTQDAVAPGGSFVYTVHFPDAGIYWYHPHVREDIEQAMGLFGNMLVDSPDARLLLAGEPRADARARRSARERRHADSVRQGGARLRAHGSRRQRAARERRAALHAAREARARSCASISRTSSSSRTYNISFGGAPIKVVASDVSRFEREERVPSVVLAPAERYVVEVRFDKPGRYALVNAIQAINHYRGEFEPEVDTLGIVTVDATPATPDYAQRSSRRCARTRR